MDVKILTVQALYKYTFDRSVLQILQYRPWQYVLFDWLPELMTELAHLANVLLMKLTSKTVCLFKTVFKTPNIVPLDKNDI